MKIYTGSGDRGKTSLFSGERVPKSHSRIDAFGDVDELNSCLGVLAAALENHPETVAEIRRIQSDLFHVGARLATTPGSPAADAIASFDTRKSRFLESAIDRMAQDLAPLNTFILPGGRMPAALAQLARTVCRRAERHVVDLSGEGADGRMPDDLREILVYLNRLGDYLFTLARYCNHLEGESDVPWSK